MNNDKINLAQFDPWLVEGSEFAALVMHQWLVSVEGKDAVIFPPTYAKPERMKDEDWLGYNIDRFNDGTSVCQIDSVGSQANRMEPIFMRKSYKGLVPKIVVKAKAGDQEQTVNLLEAGHRAADAIIRFSKHQKEFNKAFRAIKDRGDAEPLAKLAPTSLVFGVWDSRETQVKMPRIVRSVIRAYNVKPLHRSAQYIPAINYNAENLLDAPDNKTQQDAMSQLGLNHAPAPWTHGGVQVDREIRRDATLNLAALRALGVDSKTGKNPLPLRRYILGLALVALTAPPETFLREGCQLVPDTDRPTNWDLVRHDGRHESWDVSHALALEFAEAAAKEFQVGENKEAQFDPQSAKDELRKSKEERKKKSPNDKKQDASKENKE